MSDALGGSAVCDCDIFWYVVVYTVESSCLLYRLLYHDLYVLGDNTWTSFHADQISMCLLHIRTKDEVSTFKHF